MFRVYMQFMEQKLLITKKRWCGNEDIGVIQLDVLPEKWRNLVKLATVMKNNVAPLQAAQAALIAKRVALVNLRCAMYRDQFKDKEVRTVSNHSNKTLKNSNPHKFRS